MQFLPVSACVVNVDKSPFNNLGIVESRMYALYDPLGVEGWTGDKKNVAHFMWATLNNSSANRILQFRV